MRWCGKHAGWDVKGLTHPPIRLVALLVCACLLSGVKAAAFVTSRAPSGAEIVWPPEHLPTLTYSLSSIPPVNTSQPGVQEAIRASFQAWQDVETSILRFQEGEPAAANEPGQDGVNLVAFNPSAVDFPSNSIAALTSVVFDFTSGKILDADIILNDNLTFTLDGPGTLDLQAIVTHEVGHFLGLDHVLLNQELPAFPARTPTMNPVTIGPPARTLEIDDRAGVSFLYPVDGYAEQVGILRGQAFPIGEPAPVFGGMIVAVDAETAAEVLGGISERSGDYVLYGVPPGRYTLHLRRVDPAIFLRGYFGQASRGVAPQTLGGEAQPLILNITPGLTLAGLDFGGGPLPTPIGPGQIVDGELLFPDQTDRYRLQGQAGRLLSITMNRASDGPDARGSVLDPLLEIHLPDGRRVLDDDSGGIPGQGANALIVDFRFPVTGEYLIVAAGFLGQGNETGRYSLILGTESRNLLLIDPPSGPVPSPFTLQMHVANPQGLESLDPSQVSVVLNDRVIDQQGLLGLIDEGVVTVESVAGTTLILKAERLPFPLPEISIPTTVRFRVGSDEAVVIYE